MIEWFDDLAVGMRFKSPEKIIAREEIKRFALEFDPQPYHVDEAAAEQTLLKGLAGYKEFAAENRPDGWNAWLTIAISPAAPGQPPPSATRMITK